MIRQTAASTSVLHPEVAARVVQELHEAARRAAKSVSRQLSDRELEVLRLLADSRDASRRSPRCWPSASTLLSKSHVGDILDKLHLADRSHGGLRLSAHGLVPAHVESNPAGSSFADRYFTDT